MGGTKRIGPHSSVAGDGRGRGRLHAAHRQVKPVATSLGNGHTCGQPALKERGNDAPGVPERASFRKPDHGGEAGLASGAGGVHGAAPRATAVTLPWCRVADVSRTLLHGSNTTCKIICLRAQTPPSTNGTSTTLRRDLCVGNKKHRYITGTSRKAGGDAPSAPGGCAGDRTWSAVTPTLVFSPLPRMSSVSSCYFCNKKRNPPQVIEASKE